MINSPESYESIPPITFKRVDLPLPLFPTMKTIPFSGKTILTSFKA